MTELERLRRALEGQYQVEREVGRGGMATVYQAHERKHNRPVAIKVLHPHLATAIGVERFVREIRTATRRRCARRSHARGDWPAERRPVLASQPLSVSHSEWLADSSGWGHDGWVADGPADSWVVSSSL